MEDSRIRLARDYCETYHGREKQFRKCNPQLPYSTHPMAVAEILANYGYRDAVTQCVAMLHDVVEDTPAKIDELEEVFDFEIANGVYVLSKNTITEEFIEMTKRISPELFSNFSKEDFYKFRLASARKKVRRVKVADMIHNTTDLINLKPEGRDKKVRDAENFYIPMGYEVAPVMVKELGKNIADYRAMLERI